MYYVGIDIAKSFHVVSVIDDNETKVINKAFKINNDSKGFEKLLTILEGVTLDKDDFTIGVEATLHSSYVNAYFNSTVEPLFISYS